MLIFQNCEKRQRFAKYLSQVVTGFLDCLVHPAQRSINSPSAGDSAKNGLVAFCQPRGVMTAELAKLTWHRNDATSRPKR